MWKVAKECLTYAHPITGKISHGRDSIYNCFSAVSEAYSGQARRARWHNWNMLQSLWSYAGTDHIDIGNYFYRINATKYRLMSNTCRRRIPRDRVWREYMRAWFYVARETGIHCYGYTKNVKTYLEVRDMNEQPANFNMTMSRGGLYDHLIDKHSLKTARVIFHPSQSIDEHGNYDPDLIDHNDMRCFRYGKK